MDKYFDIQYFWDAFPQLIPFLQVTFQFVIVSVFIGFAISVVLVSMRMSKWKILQGGANLYITILRCTPSIVLLFLVYYGIPAIGRTMQMDLNDIDTIYFVIVTFSLQFGAIMAEVIRSALLSVDRGQFEAAHSVGMTNFQTYRRIIIPQATVIALPNVATGLIQLLQEGALAYTIGFVDIVGKAELIIASNFDTHALEIYLALAIIYWLLAICIERLFAWLEHILQKNKRPLQWS